MSNVTHENFAEIHAVAEAVAVKAAAATKERIGGDRGACGFAWVNVYNVRSNSKLGKEMAKVGFRKAYGGGLQLWNPGKAMVQSVEVLESGAVAYAKILKDVGLEAYAGSRLD